MSALRKSTGRRRLGGVAAAAAVLLALSGAPEVAWAVPVGGGGGDGGGGGGGNDPCAGITGTLTVTPSTIIIGQSVTATWSVNRPRGCSGTQSELTGPGAPNTVFGVGGSATFAPPAVGTPMYSVTGFVPGGADSVAAQSITVLPAPPPHGGVYSVGFNGTGALGDGTTTERLATGPVPALPDNVIQVARGGTTAYCDTIQAGTAAPFCEGEQFSLALLSNGTVDAWGSQARGELGDNFFGTATDAHWRLAPQPISGLTGIVQIAASGPNGYALDVNGVVWDWGDFSQSPYGDDCCINAAPHPMNLSGVPRLAAIAIGSYADGYSLGYGLAQNGTVWNLFSRTQVSGLPAIAQIAVGDQHVLALDTHGTVWSWGSNAFGQLGNETNSDSSTPVQAHGLPAGIGFIAAGGEDSFAISGDASRTLYAWGRNDDGELGDGSFNDHNSAVSTGLTGVAQVSASIDNLYDSACNGQTGCYDSKTESTGAVLTNGSALTWGANPYGGLGQPGIALHYDVPTPMSGVVGALQIAIGWHTLILAAPQTGVPNIVGDTLPQAQAALAGEGLALGNETDVVQSDCGTGVNKVVGQNPATGQVEPRGSTVDFSYGVLPAHCP